MIVTERHPLDGVLADWGFLVRGVRAGKMDEATYRAVTARIRADLTAIDAALGQRIGAALDRLEEVEETGRMTAALFNLAAAEIREVLTARRFNARPVLVVIQGGLATPIQPHIQGA